MSLVTERSVNRPMRSRNAGTVHREDIVLVLAAARPTTLLLGSTTLPALQNRAPPRYPPETPLRSPEWCNVQERAVNIVESDAQIASAIVNVWESASYGAKKDVTSETPPEMMRCSKGAPDMAPIEMWNRRCCCLHFCQINVWRLFLRSPTW